MLSLSKHKIVACRDGSTKKYRNKKVCSKAWHGTIIPYLHVTPKNKSMMAYHALVSLALTLSAHAQQGLLFSGCVCVGASVCLMPYMYFSDMVSLYV